MSARASIVVPIRSLTDGKTRLAPVLDPGERSALTRDMLDRVVRAALNRYGQDPVLLEVMEGGTGALGESGRAAWA